MSYYANADGYISFRELTAEERDELLKKATSFCDTNKYYPFQRTSGDPVTDSVMRVLADHFEGLELDDCFVNKGDWAVFNVYGNDLYRSDDLAIALDLLLPYMSSCNISFRGEDDSYWRILLVDGQIREDSGAISYEPFDTLSSSEVNIIKKALLAYIPTDDEQETLQALIKAAQDRASFLDGNGIKNT